MQCKFKINKYEFILEVYSRENCKRVVEIKFHQTFHSKFIFIPHKHKSFIYQLNDFKVILNVILWAHVE